MPVKINNYKKYYNFPNPLESVTFDIHTKIQYDNEYNITRFKRFSRFLIGKIGKIP